MEGGDDTGWFHYDFTSCGGGQSSSGKRRLILRGGGGGGFAVRISSKTRLQDPGGGAARIAAPRGVIDIEVTNSPELSVVERQSVPSRISVVLVEEAKVGGTQCLGCPRVDQDLRLLARVVKLASVTVCEDTRIPFPVGPVGPIGLCGTQSPSDFEPVGPDWPYVGPVGPCGTQSPSDFEPVGPDGPYVGPVGPRGTLSPSDSEPVGLDGPYVGPVGPCGM